jgi:DNA-binding response OmpR family regulator
MGKRILFVEEDAGFGRVFTHAIREALVDEGLGVAFAEAGFLAKARSRLREGGLDAALIDVRLPDGNGLDLVGEIHDGGVGSPIPTLVLTANLDASVAVEALDAGARGALSKLAPMREAIDAIRRLTDTGSSEE